MIQKWDYTDRFGTVEKALIELQNQRYEIVSVVPLEYTKNDIITHLTKALIIYKPKYTH